MKKKKTSRQVLFRKLDNLYERMVEQYNVVAEEVGLSCADCENNCCTSYFQHHTYVEWAYMWKGLNELPEAKREEFIARAQEYVRCSQNAISFGNRPNVMCPLNDDGLCGLYKHRLMICRMHGIPNLLTNPNGKQINFAGCFRTQALTDAMESESKEVPVLDRTELYKELVALEMQFVGPKLRKLPRVDYTLAEMIVMGPPKF
ncbi:MAG: hypothetical protein ACNI27_02295 [Desulfovibrio sp.]